jgi:hypothetical protein
MKEYPCISIQQPWVHAIFHLGKDVENRTWPLVNYRGELAIHASRTVNTDAVSEYGLGAVKLPTGVIVGTVDLYDVIRNSRSKWAEKGQYHWLIRRPKLLRRPIPALGNATMSYVKLDLRINGAKGGRPKGSGKKRKAR